MSNQTLGGWILAVLALPFFALWHWVDLQYACLYGAVFCFFLACVEEKRIRSRR